MTLADAPILVTGASSGIGRAAALALAEHGARLAVAGRRRELLDGLAAQVAGRGLAKPYVIEADLAAPGNAAEVARKALDALGGMRVVVNNAGVGLVGAQTALGDDAAARAVFETNLWSPLALVRELYPALRDDAGLVANVTSSLQAVPIPLLGYYGASKAAFAHLTRTLRLELSGTGVGVLEFVPGATDTAARDVDLLPWKNRPMRTPPPVTPESAAAALVRAVERRSRRAVHPRTSLLPLEIPAIGRLVARLTAPRIDTAQALRAAPLS